MRPLIDTHLDLAWNALQWDRDLTLPLVDLRAAECEMTDHPARGRATVSLPELRDAGVRVCLATILTRAKPWVRPRDGFSRRDLDLVNQTAASAVGVGQLEYYRLLEALGKIRILRTAGDLQDHWAMADASADAPKDAALGIVVAMEGADPIVSPAQAETWWGRGLRCVGLAHYGIHPYACGTGVQGDITALGRDLLGEFDRLGMILDLTHCAEPGFFQALSMFSGRVIASHNMCRALVPGDRQFSDDQIRALIERDAVIGMACDAWMLCPDYRRGTTPRSAASLGTIADHVEHVCSIAGNTRHVAIGSDLDGGYGTEQTPHDLDSIADLQKLSGILAARGFSEADCDAIFFGNAFRFLCESLPQTQAVNVHE
jgi:membrane dipeptidase